MRSLLYSSLLALCGALWARAFAQAAATQKRSVPPGFVTTNGRNFELDGKPFAFVGANAYWLPLLNTERDVDYTMQQIQASGAKVVRTWAFNAINETELPSATETGLTYYQVWNSSDWVVNDGPQGLQRLDYVVSSAEKHGLKLIVTFGNNWAAYGGIELYINWIYGAENATHDIFFTDPAIIASYQRYIKTIVERYKESSAVFAWELVNEARCTGDILSAGPNCVPGSNTLKTWYSQQSDFVRSLDANHMITAGGEGQFFSAHPAEYWFDGSLVSDYNFNGQAGEDFAGDLELPNLDFAGYHMYPQTWYPELDFPGSNFSVEEWGLGWISDHASAAAKANKPLIIEEFGVTGLQNKTDIYPSWVQHALDTGHARVMPWQFGVLGLTEDGGNRAIKYSDQIFRGASPNDGKTHSTLTRHKYGISSQRLRVFKANALDSH
ncbi:glycoside hydrolase family 5 protein [Gelatoporia subvermispora B]|uniref:mannan endo-1,4-beta-mannosidase n=1 Tax=Ceriporiopsis subvermispora (strain B) TaxID=914234 RepID=M2PZ25_CERS8|nr:glycoside hydrolase family 5 protein [Gelatoporia subvermispora B]